MDTQAIFEEEEQEWGEEGKKKRRGDGRDDNTIM